MSETGAGPVFGKSDALARMYPFWSTQHSQQEISSAMAAHGTDPEFLSACLHAASSPDNVLAAFPPKTAISCLVDALEFTEHEHIQHGRLIANLLIAIPDVILPEQQPDAVHLLIHLMRNQCQFAAQFPPNLCEKIATFAAAIIVPENMSINSEIEQIWPNRIANPAWPDAMYATIYRLAPPKIQSLYTLATIAKAEIDYSICRSTDLLMAVTNNTPLSYDFLTILKSHKLCIDIITNPATCDLFFLQFIPLLSTWWCLDPNHQLIAFITHPEFDTIVLEKMTSLASEVYTPPGTQSLPEQLSARIAALRYITGHGKPPSLLHPISTNTDEY